MQIRPLAGSFWSWGAGLLHSPQFLYRETLLPLHGSNTIAALVEAFLKKKGPTAIERSGSGETTALRLIHSSVHETGRKATNQ